MDINLPDTSTRAKLQGLLDQFYNIDPYYERMRLQSGQALDAAFNAAQQRIGAQFTPAMRLAQARLGASPLLADSGYANRLNRQIQSTAFGDLSNAYGQAASESAQGLQSGLERLIQQRLGGAGQILQASLTAPKKRKAGQVALGALGGAASGAFGGSF